MRKKSCYVYVDFILCCHSQIKIHNIRYQKNSPPSDNVESEIKKERRDKGRNTKINKKENCVKINREGGVVE
jgi:hypothetical protein